ncbi:MAG: hypothetical protein ABIB98_02380 [bacterium]
MTLIDKETGRVALYRAHELESVLERALSFGIAVGCFEGNPNPETAANFIFKLGIKPPYINRKDWVRFRDQYLNRFRNRGDFLENYLGELAERAAPILMEEAERLRQEGDVSGARFMLDLLGDEGAREYVDGGKESAQEW